MRDVEKRISYDNNEIVFTSEKDSNGFEEKKLEIRENAKYGEKQDKKIEMILAEDGY